jgi:TetR/AcrR family transcriptional regulator, fatty acid metabolism regulator protein
MPPATKKKKPTSETIAGVKRARILESAIKVFAAKGYHGCRVSDIATEAGIAYGLVYHYFTSKEEILNSIFQEKWSIFLKVMRSIDESPITFENKLKQIAHFLISGFELMPELMEVLILEIARSQKVMEKQNLRLLNEAFEIIEEMFRVEKKLGNLRSDADPQLAAHLFFGFIESILTAYVMKTLKTPSNDEREKMENYVVDSFLRGIVPR